MTTTTATGGRGGSVVMSVFIGLRECTGGFIVCEVIVFVLLLAFEEVGVVDLVVFLDEMMFDLTAHRRAIAFPYVLTGEVVR